LRDLFRAGRIGVMNRRITAILVLALAVLAAAPVAAECSIGPAPALPDGSTASEAEIRAAEQSVKVYLAETQEFLACIEREGKGQMDEVWRGRFDEAAVRRERIAAAFNRQLRAFRSK